MKKKLFGHQFEQGICYPFDVTSINDRKPVAVIERAGGNEPVEVYDISDIIPGAYLEVCTRTNYAVICTCTLQDILDTYEEESQSFLWWKMGSEP